MIAILDKLATDYIELMRDIIIALAFLCSILIYMRAHRDKEPMLYLMAISRFFLGATYIYIQTSPDIPTYLRIYASTAIIVILIVDLAWLIFNNVSRKYRDEIALQSAKVAMMKMEAKNHFVLEHCPIGIYQYSVTTYTFMYVNPAFAGYFGMLPKDLIGKSIFGGMSEKYIAQVKQSALDRLAGKLEVMVQEIKIELPPSISMTLSCEAKVVYNGEATILGYARLVQ